MFNNSNFGNGTTISIGDKVTQNISNNSQRDLSELTKYFEEIGFSKEDVTDLKNSIEEDGIVSEKTGYGQKVLAWTEKMLTKSAEKVVSSATTNVKELINEGLKNYFGF